MRINEKQIYKRHAYFRAKIQRDFKVFQPWYWSRKGISFSGILRPTINKFYKLFHERIVELCEVESPFENGEIELDESYFGVGRVRGKRGRGAGGKIPVFGILKKGDKIYT